MASAGFVQLLSYTVLTTNGQGSRLSGIMASAGFVQLLSYTVLTIIF